MILFKVDVGETWTIIANNRKEALALYIEDVLASEGDWPEERPPIRALDPAKEYTVELDGAKVTLTGYRWVLLIAKPQVLSCSLI